MPCLSLRSCRKQLTDPRGAVWLWCGLLSASWHSRQPSRSKSGEEIQNLLLRDFLVRLAVPAVVVGEVFIIIIFISIFITSWKCLLLIYLRGTALLVPW